MDWVSTTEILLVYSFRADVYRSGCFSFQVGEIMLMRDAEKAIKKLTESGDKESVEILERLVSEVRILRSQGRRLKRNKKGLCVKLEKLTAD